MFLIQLLIIIQQLCFVKVHSHATSMLSSRFCGLPLKEGVIIMGYAVTTSSSNSLIVTRGNNVLISNIDEYYPGETLSVAVENSNYEYVIETTTNAQFTYGGCSGRRIANTDGVLNISASATGNIELWVGWTNSQAIPVSVSKHFVLLFPTIFPSIKPTCDTTQLPTITPTHDTSDTPSVTPSDFPINSFISLNPSMHPTCIPSQPSSIYPSCTITYKPSTFPTNLRSNKPSQVVTTSCQPTTRKSEQPTQQSERPTSMSTTIIPTVTPSSMMTILVTLQPTESPNKNADISPTSFPTTFQPSNSKFPKPSKVQSTYIPTSQITHGFAKSYFPSISNSSMTSCPTRKNKIPMTSPFPSLNPVIVSVSHYPSYTPSAYVVTPIKVSNIYIGLWILGITLAIILIFPLICFCAISSGLIHWFNYRRQFTIFSFIAFVSVIASLILVIVWCQNSHTHEADGYLGSSSNMPNTLAMHVLFMVMFFSSQIFSILLFLSGLIFRYTSGNKEIVKCQYAERVESIPISCGSNISQLVYPCFHIIFQLTSLGCLIIGISSILKYMNSANKQSWLTIHSYLGITCCIGYGFYFIWGIFQSTFLLFSIYYNNSDSSQDIVKLVDYEPNTSQYFNDNTANCPVSQALTPLNEHTEFIHTDIKSVPIACRLVNNANNIIISNMSNNSTTFLGLKNTSNYALQLVISEIDGAMTYRNLAVLSIGLGLLALSTGVMNQFPCIQLTDYDMIIPISNATSHLLNKYQYNSNAYPPSSYKIAYSMNMIILVAGCFAFLANNAVTNYYYDCKGDDSIICSKFILTNNAISSEVKSSIVGIQSHTDEPRVTNCQEIDTDLKSENFYDACTFSSFGKNSGKSSNNSNTNLYFGDVEEFGLWNSNMELRDSESSDINCQVI